MKNYNAIIWCENETAKTIASACVVENGVIVHGTEFSLKHKRPYTPEELQANCPGHRFWLEMRDDAKALYKLEIERMFQGLPSMNYIDKKEC